RCAVHMAAACVAATKVEVLEDLGLQCRSQTLHVPDAILPRRFLKLREGRDPKCLIELEHLFGSKPGHRHQLEHARGYFLAHGLKAWMRTGQVEPGHTIGDGLADTRDLLTPPLG